MLQVEIYSSNRKPSGLVKLLEDTTAQHFTLTMYKRHGEKERFTTQTGETPQLNVCAFRSQTAMFSVSFRPTGNVKFDFTKLLKDIGIICKPLVRKLKIIHTLFIHVCSLQ